MFFSWELLCLSWAVYSGTHCAVGGRHRKHRGSSTSLSRRLTPAGTAQSFFACSHRWILLASHYTIFPLLPSLLLFSNIVVNKTTCLHGAAVNISGGFAHASRRLHTLYCSRKNRRRKTRRLSDSKASAHTQSGLRTPREEIPLLCT